MKHNALLTLFSNYISKTRHWYQLVFIFCAVIVIVSLISHFTVHFLRISTSPGKYQNYGANDRVATTRLYGSSVAYSAIDWSEISKILGAPIESWASLGQTPSEWEYSPRPSKEIKRIFIAISPVDLNEHALSDFRVDYVPLTQTIRDLWQVQADFSFNKRVLSQYPTRALRVLFPTVGRSDGVMTGIRDELKKMTRIGSSSEPDEAFRFKMEGDSGLEEKVSDWPPGRLQRRLALTRAACQGKHSFNGLKKMALTRLVQNFKQKGQLIFIVLPVSPIYQEEFLTAKVKHEFEMELADFQSLWPQAKLIRLDKLPPLQDNSMYWDFVHANHYGQQIMTSAFLTHLDHSGRLP
ncbi:MAG: hypothetical protein WAP08_04830 [Smithellaceae bacterium]|jgi:hypothetical protein|nr:hypothetical protein [Syntrophaceae bacterium]